MKGGEGENNSPMSHCDSLVVMVVDKGPGGWEKHTNESWRLIGGRGGWQRARRARSTHQQVVMTHWWLMKGWEGENNTPTSCWDLLVVVVVDKGPGGREQLTNKLLWLVGGRQRARRVRKMHQWVVATHWWSWWSTKDWEGEIYTPTSRHDLLMVDKGLGGWEQHTNELSGLVGGHGGQWRTGRVRWTTHQRVAMTHWWLMKGQEGENNSPTSHWDLLVVVVVNEGLGGRDQHTNESLWLVGGQWRAGRARLLHQRVVATRWWSWWLMKDWGCENNTPTSHRDSLVVVVVDEERGGRWWLLVAMVGVDKVNL